MDFAYPLQTCELPDIVDDMQNYLLEYDVFNAGRGGMFNYCDADLAYCQGKVAVIESIS